MTSQINYAAIDATYPVAGQDNDSQGFRNNFSAVKTALQYAQSEITDLQNNGAVVTDDNNFGGNQIYNAEFKYNRQTVFTIGTVTGSISVNYQNAQIQTLTTSGNITLSFTNWPTSTKAGSILLLITLGAGTHTITYPGSVVTPALWSNPNTAGTYLLEFTTTNNGSTIYLTNKSGVSYYDKGNQQITGPGAINVTQEFTSINTTGTDAYTLANGSEGQRKTIIMNGDSGNGTLTPSNVLGFSDIEFTAVGQSVTLVFLNTKWNIVASYGVTINP
jgi:hypothetical protein